MPQSAQSYFGESRGLLYSYIACLPLLFLYELLIFISQPDSQHLVRISVDVWFKMVFSFLGLNAISATLIIAALAGGFIVFKQREKLQHLRKRYFLYMIMEALLYAVLVSATIGVLLGLFMNFSSTEFLGQMNKIQLIALSLGAGLYEELFFRVILVGFLLFIFKKIFQRKAVAYAAAVIIAALLFSAVHYIGAYGDIFTLSSFLFRFLFGLALNLIYVIRGFGMAAWTHAIYDLIVVMMM